MTLLWVILLLLHQGYTLVPVITVQLGESVTLTCLTDKFQVVTWVHWYKQSPGYTLKLIAKVHESTEPIYGVGFSASRFRLTYNGNQSNLIILSTVEQDEGMYHCAYMDWNEYAWTGTYLSLRGNSERTSSYTLVHKPAVSNPTHPTDSVTLQCSVLSESASTTCPGEPGVFWFRAISDKSYPDIIYTEGKKQEDCEKTSNNQKKCRYHFSMNVNSSEVNTYYCAVATCGEILFEKRANMVKNNQEKTLRTERIVLMITLICLAVSVTLNIICICHRTQISSCTRFKESSPSQEYHGNLSQPIDKSEYGQDLNYAALHFSRGTDKKGKNKVQIGESVYSQVK
ncbi:uncharacterized protein LOC119798108 [Cyprinodon tularosa]|uniref:uncharacterized protein LOC119798108 n=1 Tax=Cyprinodon tularosa TaxID=77115 RepID=UPI0018E27EBE|nr:uncharacterized protein LOC119798108 [Cyprinodon tularosa]